MRFDRDDEDEMFEDDDERHDDEREGAAPSNGHRAESEPGSRVSVVDEQPPRPGPPPGAGEDDYKWHTYRV
jgi:hypothetical protein